MVKVLDFGLGKMMAGELETTPAGLTRLGVMMGTCGYSAPEQLHGGIVDERADIYGLGALLYFLVAGRAPYRDEGFRTTLANQLNRPPDPLDADRQALPWAREVEAVYRKAMAPRPDDRYATPSDLLEDLSRALRPGETVGESRISVTNLSPTDPTVIRPVENTPRKSARWKRWLFAGSAAAILAATGLIAWLFYPSRAAPSASSEPGVSDTEIVLGLSAPFSGPTREHGRGIRLGIDTYFQRVNDEGGVHGRRLRLVALDDGYEPQRARENVRRMVTEDRVFAFIGNVGAPTAQETLPIILEYKRVLFGACTGTRLVRKDPPDRYVFNYRASLAEETAAIVGYLLDIRNIAPDQIAVFAQHDVFGEDGYAGVLREFRQRRKPTDKILKVGYDRNHANIEDAVKAVVAAKDRIRAVVMVATYRPASLFIQKIKDSGMDPIFTNVSFVGSETLADQLRDLGPRYVEGVIVTQVVPLYTSGATGVIRFRDDLRKYFPTESPGFVSLEGYIAAEVFVEGLKNAGPQPTSETLVEGLEKIRDLDLAIGPPITFTPSKHQGSHRVWGTILDRDGVYQDLDLE
jgi:ABC-type branched-subunit amino acid transport system substrate-binding protein